MAKKELNFDGPMFRAYEGARNMLVLNLLTILCSLPIVTFGAAYTALHSVVLKIERNEEGYIVKDYFKSFRENLKMGVGASILCIVISAFVLADFYAMLLLEAWFVDIAKVLLIIFSFFLVYTVTFFFPIMAKFESDLKTTIKNAFKFSFSHFFMTLLIIVINAVPVVVCYYVNVLIPLYFMFGISVPAYIAAILYNKSFKKMEDAFYAKRDIQ